MELKAPLPRIAHHAGLTPGAIYRRFHDKDALLEDTILGMLERQGERAKTSMSPEAAAQIPLPVFAEQVINGMVLGYRVNARCCVPSDCLFRAGPILPSGRGLQILSPGL